MEPCLMSQEPVFMFQAKSNVKCAGRCVKFIAECVGQGWGMLNWNISKSVAEERRHVSFNDLIFSTLDYCQRSMGSEEKSYDTVKLRKYG